MKKEDFIKLGIDEETAKKCEAASKEELKAFIPKTLFDEVDNEKQLLEGQIEERDKQLEGLKNSSDDVDGLKKEIEKLQLDNKAMDEAHASEIKQLKIGAALDSAISSVKGKNTKAIKALLDMTKVDLDKEGNVIGHMDQLEALTKAEDSKFLFDTEAKKIRVKGAEIGESGKEEVDTKVDMSKMSFEELTSYVEMNAEQ